MGNRNRNRGKSPEPSPIDEDDNRPPCRHPSPSLTSSLRPLTKPTSPLSSLPSSLPYPHPFSPSIPSQQTLPSSHSKASYRKIHGPSQAFRETQEGGGYCEACSGGGEGHSGPPVGPDLGSKGVNIMAFCKEYNPKTADKAGYVIPVEITVYNDKSFIFILKTPVSVLLLKAAGVEKGSNEPKLQKVGKIIVEQLRTIAQEKLPDLNCSSNESAMRIVAGTAANMGIDIDPPVLEPKKKVLV